MKRLKRITVWILVSLVIQFAVFFYLDKFYFASESTFKIKKVENIKDKNKKKLDIKLNEDNEDLSLSYRGKYLSYYEDKILKVVNTETGKVKEVRAEEGAEINYYKWLPDRNRIVIAEKERRNGHYIIKLYNYDVAKDLKEEEKETVHNASTFITLPDKKSYVEDIALSTLAHVKYIKITNSAKRSNVYRLDIMSQMTKVRNTGYIIGNIGVTNVDDHFLLEDLTYKKIRTGNGKSIKIKGVTNPCLIGIDNDDNVYIGQLEADDTIKKIYSGSLKESTDKWKVTNLNTPVEKKDLKDLYVSPINGNIYLNDNFQGIVTEVNSGKQTQYRGRFIKMYTKGIASKSDGIFVETEFK